MRPVVSQSACGTDLLRAGRGKWPGLHPDRCALAPSGDGAGLAPVDNPCMQHAFAHLPHGIRPQDADRIAAGCSHALVPDHPAAHGYRYIDLGGAEPPFYLRRIGSGDEWAAVALYAPLEFSSAADAEPGAPAVAQVRVSVGLNTLRWDHLLDVDLCSGVWADLLAEALAEVAALDLLEPSSCPVCGPVS
jgi:hypothetical protein